MLTEYTYFACVDVADDLSEDVRLVLGKADRGLWAAGGDCAPWDHTNLTPRCFDKAFTSAMNDGIKLLCIK